MSIKHAIKFVLLSSGYPSTLLINLHIEKHQSKWVSSSMNPTEISPMYKCRAVGTIYGQKITGQRTRSSHAKCIFPETQYTCKVPQSSLTQAAIALTRRRGLLQRQALSVIGTGCIVTSCRHRPQGFYLRLQKAHLATRTAPVRITDAPVRLTPAMGSAIHTKAGHSCFTKLTYEESEANYGKIRNFLI